METEHAYTLAELWRELERFERALKAADLRASSVETYVGRTRFFLRWLAGDYEPRGPVA